MPAAAEDLAFLRARIAAAGSPLYLGAQRTLGMTTVLVLPEPP